ncbi:hypothetical protein ACEQPO_07945 [Bacillus sp. SL00103]
MDDMTTEPPLGVMPKWLHDERRTEDIAALLNEEYQQGQKFLLSGLKSTTTSSETKRRNKIPETNTNQKEAAGECKWNPSTFRRRKITSKV